MYSIVVIYDTNLTRKADPSRGQLSGVQPDAATANPVHPIYLANQISMEIPAIGNYHQGP